MECHQDVGDICLNVTNEWTSGEHWFRNQNKKKRNNFSRGTRMLTQEGTLAFQLITGNPDPKLLEQLVELKRQSMAANGIKSSSDSATLLELTRALERIQALRIFVLTCNERVVAASINAVQGKVLLAYFAVYDAAFARASPGILLMTEYTKWAFDAGLTKVDYLKGEETYKFEFANGAIKLNSYIRTVTYRGHLSLALHRLWQSGRRLMASHQIPEDPEIGAAYSTKAGNVRSTPPRAAVSQADETIV
jgi:CelD/BcsL family acetyltransferase involved in cellulose biosynthesis